MWRAFFFAVGATLIILGTQGLVVDHFEIANGTRVPRFLAKYLNAGGTKVVGQQNRGLVGVLNTQQRQAEQIALNVQRDAQRASTPSNTRLPRQNGSLFGPSRLADSQFSNTNLPPNISYYGGAPYSNRQSPSPRTQFSSGANGPNPQFSLAGFDGRQGVGNSGPGQIGGAQTKARQQIVSGYAWQRWVSTDPTGRMDALGLVGSWNAGGSLHEINWAPFRCRVMFWLQN